VGSWFQIAMRIHNCGCNIVVAVGFSVYSIRLHQMFSAMFFQIFSPKIKKFHNPKSHYVSDLKKNLTFNYLKLRLCYGR